MNPRELQQLLLMPEGLRAQYLAALKKPQKMADGGGFGRKSQRINQATSFGDVPMGGNQIVKDVGGNWMGGNVEQALDPLTRTVLNDTGVKNLRARQGNEVADAYLQERPRHEAANNWVRGNLTNYVKKQMATEADPVRKLAEKGISHFPVVEDPAFWSRKGETARKNMKGKQVAQSPLAQQWENRSDPMIQRDTAQEHQDMMHLAPGMYSEKDEWIKKLPPETNLYKAAGDYTPFNARDLGFDHIMDVLREDLAAGRIRPEQMSKISMEQAVRRVHEYDQDKLKKMRDVAIKNTEGMPVHKVYDDGHKWIELSKPNLPDVLPEGWSEPVAKGNTFVSTSADGKRVLGNDLPDIIKNIYRRHPETPGNPRNLLEKALKYEGDTMGHCVGGYCPDVESGQSRIFSLRDAKGEPHVTIETQPGEGVGPKEFFMNNLAPKSLQNDIFAMEREGAFNDPYALEDFIEKSPEYKNYIKSLPPKIEQIKGKGNGKPVAKYIPMVQDFVKAGTWSDVNDLHHTDLIHLDPKSDLAKAIQATGKKPPRYVTQQELTDLSKKHNFPGWVNTPKKATGGLIHMSGGGSDIDPKVNLQMAREHAEQENQHHDPYTRSLQQGWEHGWYHGSTGDIKAFDPASRGESTGAASAKKGYFFARDPSTPPAHMLQHDPTSVEFLTKLGKPIPPNPTMKGYGAATASSYAGTGGSREYKESMRKAHAAEKAKDWDAYAKHMEDAENAEIKMQQYRQQLVASHGDARDDMYEKVRNAWYGAQNADKFKKMSQPEYKEYDEQYNALMPYGWHMQHSPQQFEIVKHHIKQLGDNPQTQRALDAIKHFQSVSNERRAADVESGANVMPVALRYKNPMYHDFQGKSYRDQTYSDLVDQARAKGHDALILKNTFDPGGSMGEPKMVDVGIVFHPHQIRSKFAAFDPRRTQESDLLAARGGSIKPVGYTKEKVTVSPSLDRMEYELMSVKHFKKAK